MEGHSRRVGAPDWQQLEKSKAMKYSGYKGDDLPRFLMPDTPECLGHINESDRAKCRGCKLKALCVIVTLGANLKEWNGKES